jgi:2-acylglycerol O-acyltransferase 2
MAEMYDSFHLKITDHLKKNIEGSFLLKGSAPKGPVLYVCHPHGLYGFSWFIHFSACLTEWPTQRPFLAVHSSLFRIPLLREMMYYSHCIQASETEILRTLAEGHSVALVLGGIEELHKTSGSSTMKLVIRKRKGFLRIAAKAGVPVVPLVTVGENELFPFLESEWLLGIQNFLYSWFHIALPVMTWKSFKEWISIVDRPLQKPLKTHLLNPLHKPTKDAYCKHILDFAKSEGVRIEIVG